MKLLYLSCHAILEFDETKLFTEMGHDVFSFGSYRFPGAPHDSKRPSYEGSRHEDLETLAQKCADEHPGETPQSYLPQEMIDWADVIIDMHVPEWIIKNWSKMKNKNVIWRTIGQSVPEIESQLAVCRRDGLKIVRYSPGERGLVMYAGEDAMIRFYKDPEEFKDWNGSKDEVISVAQSMPTRGRYCNYNTFRTVTEGLPRKLFGPGNESAGIEGGVLSYDDLKKAYRDYRVYFYTGTYPASYTLNFIEALMTGIPVVAIGGKFANIEAVPGVFTYEVDKLIDHKVNGFCSNDPEELRGNVDWLLAHYDEAKKISEWGRKLAIDLFGKEKIRSEWEQFFAKL